MGSVGISVFCVHVLAANARSQPAEQPAVVEPVSDEGRFIVIIYIII